eukprot:1944830-Rhodomonas_salina.1
MDSAYQSVLRQLCHYGVGRQYPRFVAGTAPMYDATASCCSLPGSTLYVSTHSIIRCICTSYCIVATTATQGQYRTPRSTRVGA